MRLNYYFLKFSLMYRSLFLLLLLSWINIHPTFAKEKVLNIDTHLIFHSKNILGFQNNLRSSEKNLLKLDIKYHLDTLSSKIAFNYNEYNQLTFDGSHLEYTSGIATFGLGAIDRHWSFSDRTSLIISRNARPIKSIYMKLKNEFGYDWLPEEADWSLEIFNGLTENSLNNSQSMLLGLRAILSPTKGLDLELFQTGQWGGKGYSNSIDAAIATLLFDTNNNSNANINKMAGFGISFLTSNNLRPLRIYGQAVGEDEAGSLPSCYAYLAGLEYSDTKIRYPTTIGIETVDTRTKTSTNGNCGPNAFYNNNIYDYTNYGNTLGASIDTESTSIEFFGQAQISQEINVEYSAKTLVINDKSWSDHRLSSKRQTGLINSLGLNWTKGNLKLKGNIYYQNLALNRTKIKNGYGIGVFSSIKF